MSGSTKKQVLDCTVAPCFSILAIINDMLLCIREAHLRKQFNSNKRDEVAKLDGSVWRVGVIVCGGMVCRWCVEGWCVEGWCVEGWCVEDGVWGMVCRGMVCGGRCVGDGVWRVLFFTCRDTASLASIHCQDATQLMLPFSPLLPSLVQ